jgi:hypothetical protein
MTSFEATVTVSAGYDGTFREIELVCWLRSVDCRRTKLLVVQAVRPEDDHCLGGSQRSFDVAELELSEEKCGSLLASLHAAGIPERPPRIADTSSGEPIWWAHLDFTASVNGKDCHVAVGLGPEGLRGADADVLRAFFGGLLEAAHCRDEHVVGLLTRPQPDS